MSRRRNWKNDLRNATAMSRVVNIDLSHVASAPELLSRLGDVLELGGPGGNHPVKEGVQGAGWGMNWNALKDSLCYLDSGGIWGSSVKLEFPVVLRLANHAALERAARQDLETLKSILAEVKRIYAKSGVSFDFEFEE